MNAVNFAYAVLKILPLVVAAGGEALGLVRQANAAVSAMQAQNRGPSDAEWQALNDTITGLMAQLSGD